METREIYDFGPFRLDIAERLLSKSGARVPLPPKAFDTLTALVRSHGRLQEKEQLLKSIWPDTFVEEGNLALNISLLRKALDAGGPYIETVPRRGYRFIAEVRTPHATSEVPPAVVPKRRLPIGMAAAAALLCVAAATTWLLWPQPYGKSIVVLPFINFTGSAANDYFADGFTEEVIDQLSNVAGLRVISRTSAFSYKGKPQDVREIGKHLGVSMVLEGSVRRAGGEWRITAQLIDARDGAHLWSRTYERGSGDVFSVQDELSREIAAGFHLSGPPAGDDHPNPEAHDLVMRAKSELSLRTGEGLAHSRELIQRALSVDPRNARAYAALSEYHRAAAEYGIEVPAEAKVLCREAAEKAISFNDRLGVAHVSLGVVLLEGYWDWSGADREFRRAIEVEPGGSEGYSWHGFLLMQRGRIDEGLGEIRHALSLDPLALRAHSNYAMALYLARRYGEAIAEAHRSIELAPASVIPYYRRGWAYAAKGDCPAALADAEIMKQRGASPLVYLALRGYCDPGNAAEYARRLEAVRKPNDRSPWAFALIWCGAGERDKFFDAWDRALDLPDTYMVFTGIDPILDPMRKDPRYAVRLKRLGL